MDRTNQCSAARFNAFVVSFVDLLHSQKLVVMICEFLGGCYGTVLGSRAQQSAPRLEDGWISALWRGGSPVEAFIGV